MTDDAERRQMRTALRRARRALEPHARAAASLALARHAARSLMLTRAKHYACFLSADGEVDTAPLISRLIRRGATVWLPCLGQPTLRFRVYEPGMPMQRGDFGILEPATGPFATIRQMDVALMPLVGFDNLGNRLGMGGGFYDRSLAFMRGPAAALGPRLVGIALELQRVAMLDAQPWDVPLDAVLTEAGYQRFSGRAASHTSAV